MQGLSQQFAGLWSQLAGTLLFIGFSLVVYQAVSRGLRLLAEREFISRTAQIVARNAVRWLVILAVAVVVFDQIGVDFSGLFAGLLTLLSLVAIGFVAVWSTLSNIMCALLLVLFDTFQIGDQVEVVEPVGGTGLKGRVKGFNIMFTTLEERSPESGEPVLTQVPNSIFFQKSLRRWPGSRAERLGKHLLQRPLAPGRTEHEP